MEGICCNKCRDAVPFPGQPDDTPQGKAESQSSEQYSVVAITNTAADYDKDTSVRTLLVAPLKTRHPAWYDTLHMV